jgi:hypothetical protein
MSTSIFVPAKSAFSISFALQVVGCALAVLSSTTLIWLAHNTLVWCYGYSGGCGTPCASSSFALLIAPIVLVLPFVRLLAAKGLSTLGLIARCAVTSGIGVWGVAIAILARNGLLL